MTRIALDPGAGGQSLSIEALQPADIIVSTTNAGVSRTIRAGTGSRISHAMLYAGYSNVIEAIDQGVMLRSLHNALADAVLAVVYRKAGLSAGVAQGVVSWARARSGRPYDLAGAAAHAPQPIFIIIGRRAHSRAMRERARTATADDKFFCSQLVIRAFEENGHPIIDGHLASMNPQQLVNAWSNGRLEYVGHLLT